MQRIRDRLWLQTPKGKELLARTARKHYARPFYAEFLVFKKEAFRDQLPCPNCGKLWIDGPRSIGHEIDHIIPLGLGGTHKRSNLQVLCYVCHLAKTALDIEKIYLERKVA